MLLTIWMQESVSVLDGNRFSKDTQGIGLGLPLSKTIDELHGGDIKGDSVLEENITELSV